MYKNKNYNPYEKNLGYQISDSDIKFLEKIQKDSFNFFMDLKNPKNGLVPDSSSWGSPCSVAGMGFFLSAICIANYRGWISRKEAYDLTHQILKTFLNDVQGYKGFFYHFVDMETGIRVWKSELSSIDTALFFAGALFAGEYFGDEVRTLSKELFNRVDWEWMTNGKKSLCLGWKPDYSFLNSYWSAYSEHMILYAMAIGAENNNIPAEYWFEWIRHKGEYEGNRYVYAGTGSLFVYQYSHAWIDFRQINDGKIDWWENSVKATITNRQYCIDNADKYETFNENCWGVTASQGPGGYQGYGVQVGYYPVYDGTVAPCGPAGSMPFLPKECIDALKFMNDNYEENIYTKYGFVDAFNIDEDWFALDHLAIDQGITILMIENFRSQLVWKYFMRLPFVIVWGNLITKK